MTVPTSRRAEGYPRLTSRRHWKSYALGMLTEVAFILGLAGMGLLIAVLARVIWR